MRVFTGIDLGSTTTKAVILDSDGEVLGRGITNSRSNYDLAARIARDEAFLAARLEILDREIRKDPALLPSGARFRSALQQGTRTVQHLAQLDLLEGACREACESARLDGVRGPLSAKVRAIVAGMRAEVVLPRKRSLLEEARKPSEFFRDRASSGFSAGAERMADAAVRFEDLMAVFDKAILHVESTPSSQSFEESAPALVEDALTGLPESARGGFLRALERTIDTPLAEARVIGTGYGRQRLPFPKEAIRSEILCHGLGAHHLFPRTRTVLDIGGQDTKAIQVDGDGVVTGFQMNDRCAAGCGRYLGYIADEMSLGVHELGPLALSATRQVKITSTCTVFAGAELRDRLSSGQRREDILAGLHRAIVLRAMALLARSGGVDEELTFTGGVANNQAAVRALTELVAESYGTRTINISPGSIYTGALGAALFARRAALAEDRTMGDALLGEACA